MADPARAPRRMGAGRHPLNPSSDTASNAQILFPVLNASSLTLLPVSIFIYLPPRQRGGRGCPTRSARIARSLALIVAESAAPMRNIVRCPIDSDCSAGSA